MQTHLNSEFYASSTADSEKCIIATKIEKEVEATITKKWIKTISKVEIRILWLWIEEDYEKQSTIHLQKKVSTNDSKCEQNNLVIIEK